MQLNAVFSQINGKTTMDRKNFRNFLHDKFGLTDDIILDRYFVSEYFLFKEISQIFIDYIISKGSTIISTHHWLTISTSKNGCLASASS